MARIVGVTTTIPFFLRMARIAAAATVIPVSRAVRLDPVKTLREE